MTVVSNGTGLNRRTLAIGGAIVLAAAAAASAPMLDLHAPDWSLLAAQSLAVKVHLAVAVGGVAIGAGLMLGVKGRRLHRIFGWACALLVFATAVSSLFIRTSGQFSWIHGLSAWVMLALPLAVLAARRHDVKRHRSLMTGLFYGGLVTAGLFAFTPGRVLFETFFG